MSQQVIFKGTKNGITIIFDKDMEFENLCKSLIDKIEDASKFFTAKSKTPIAFRGRDFTEEEERKVLDIIIKYTNIDIVFLKDFGDEDNVDKLKQKNESNHSVDNLEKVVKDEIVDKNNKDDLITKTLYHQGSLRGGQVLSYKGSIVLIGDVNVGAEIRATGNIIIMGQLRGKAHSGYGGNENTFISAVYMAPMLLRIGDLITTFPEERKKGNKPAEYAFIKDEKVCVMTLI